MIICRDSPFVLYCPYENECGWMEACEFPKHSETRHTTNNQKYPCPICELMVI